MKRSMIAAWAGIVSLAAPAAAVVLAPSRASQVVVLRRSGAGTVCLPKGGGLDVDLQMAPDGSNQPFTQPSDQALVITGIDWAATGGTAGQNITAVIRLAGTPITAQLAFETGAVADAAGATIASALVPNVVVAPGLTVCAGAGGPGGGSLSQLVIHGFLTANK